MQAGCWVSQGSSSAHLRLVIWLTWFRLVGVFPFLTSSPPHPWLHRRRSSIRANMLQFGCRGFRLVLGNRFMWKNLNESKGRQNASRSHHGQGEAWSSNRKKGLCLGQRIQGPKRDFPLFLSDRSCDSACVLANLVGLNSKTRFTSLSLAKEVPDWIYVALRIQTSERIEW